MTRGMIPHLILIYHTITDPCDGSEDSNLPSVSPDNPPPPPNKAHLQHIS